MKFSIITLFPEVFDPILKTSILKRAVNKGLVEFELIDLRPFGEGVHQVVDDKPFGGGTGLVFKADILAKALKKAASDKSQESRVVLTSASGAPFKQQKAQELSKIDHLIIICGHYEGVDQRFIDKYVDEEISIGDYVLTGGEIPAMVIVDSITRLIPNVLAKEDATQNESFSLQAPGQNSEHKLLEYPQYTRPADFEGMMVPDVLVSGDHEAVDKWREEQAIKKTREVRPDLLSD